MKILVSGANGFIGRSLCLFLSKQGHSVVAAVRRPSNIAGEHLIGDEFLWNGALRGCDCVIHLAGCAEVTQEQGTDSLLALRAVNVDMSLKLATLSAQAGVRRFVFMSTLKVNGESTALGTGFKASDVPKPGNPYALSKWEAEQGLLAIANNTGLELVIIRPPIVYGPNVKGNFLSLVRWLSKGVPLPLGSVHNLRSMIALENLISFTALCADYQASLGARGQVFLVSDGEDVSTTVLLRKIGQAYGFSTLLVPVPEAFLRFGLKLLGQAGVSDRLLGSLSVDDSKARELLGWHPPVSMDEQLQKMANVAPI